MKRRGFLQSLAGLVGLVAAPTIQAKQKELLPPVNVSDAATKTSKPYFSHLTIDDFGAKDTKCLPASSLCPDGYVTKRYVDLMTTGINYKPPAALFPNEAIVGDAFLFEPKTYRTYPLDRETITRLEGSYIYTESGWRHLIGIARTEDIAWSEIVSGPTSVKGYGITNHS